MGRAGRRPGHRQCLLYAFFVHFNRLFLVSVAAFGLAFWAFIDVVGFLEHALTVFVGGLFVRLDRA